MTASSVVYSSQDPNILISVPTTNEKGIVLSFDDGPGRVLPEILDVLKEEKVPAAFFWQSRLLYAERPWKRVLAEGHEIGTHSSKHLNLAALSYEEQYRDLFNSKVNIEKITGKTVKYFRPPFGQYNADTIKAAAKLDLTPVMWRIASVDWELEDQPDQIILNVIQNLEDGAIILMHELRQTAKILHPLIKEIKNKGYQFKPLSPQ